MRHAVKGKKLKRTSSHKKALLTSLAVALFKHKKIKTTVAKAKEARIFVERLITKARRGDIPARRYVARFIKDREVLKELFNEIVAKIGKRPGGYTRVVKIGARKGDGADLAILELVDYNEGEVKTPKKKDEKVAETPKEEKTTEEVVEKDEAVVSEQVDEKLESSSQSSEQQDSNVPEKNPDSDKEEK
ncbi:MAG: 50S ribosomal protein L17 [Ignavibacteria bacterium]